MAEGILHDYPGLKPFVLSEVQLTGTRIGGGAYGRVDEVAFPVTAAAKTDYAFLQESDGTVEDLPKVASEFVRECQLMSTLRHPNIVQFLGVTFFSGSRLPALIMERLLTSLHDLLAPDMPLPQHTVQPLDFFSMGLKCSVLQDVARGLVYLHGQSPPIIHRDLSARNILLNSGMVAKIADLGVARIALHMRAATTMTKGPEASVYMPPEATAPAKSSRDMAKNDTSIDIFSLGVVAIFTISENFPCDPLEPNYVDEKSGLLVARTELQLVNVKLSACGQLCARQPFIRLIQQCLQNLPVKRPVIHKVQTLLEEARACFGDTECEKNRNDLIRALQAQPSNLNLECVVGDLVTENAALWSRNQTKDRELAEAQQKLREKEKQVTSDAKNYSKLQLQLREKNGQLWSSERKRETLQQMLIRKQAELTRAEETIKREQQQIQEMKQRETEIIQAKDRELAEAQQQLREKEEQLRSSIAPVADLKLKPSKSAPYTCHVSGPGLKSATVNHPTHIIVELTEYSARQHPQTLILTAQLDLVIKAPLTTPPQATPTRSWLSRFNRQREKRVAVTMVSPSRYKVAYTPLSRGHHKLHVQVNNKEINGSPFTVTVYLEPTQLGHPVRVVTDMYYPYGIVYNSREEMIVSELGGHRVSNFILEQGKIQAFGSRGNQLHEMKFPAGIATDDADNIYVSSCHKLHKFTWSGRLIKCTGERGKKNGEFDDPRGLTLYDNEVYVCDSGNHRVQIFDLDLNFVRSIGSGGEGRGEFNEPYDIDIDTFGNLYVAEWGNGRVQVMDRSGQFIREFGGGELKEPSGLHIADKYVYVSDLNSHCIVVYEISGQFVTSFGRSSHNEVMFSFPCCITSSVDGYIHVCDFRNDRVQIF